MLNLSYNDKQAIVDAMRHDFASTVQRYDGYKYPEDVYDSLRTAFHTRESVTADHIRDALIWKYGHWRKPNFPSKHKTIIARIQTEWAAFVERNLSDAEQIFNYWTDTLSAHQSFITVTFLVHLLMSDEIPIIDQHNFRAMNFFLRTHWAGHRKPSHFNDVLKLREFVRGIQEHWAKCTYPNPPDDRSIDKYLMVFGQDLKKELPA